jgi:glutathione S-transferase
MSPYGDFDIVMNTLIERLSQAPYLLGDTVSAADVLWGLALNWGTAFGLVPPNPVLADYIARMTSRPAFLKVTAFDAKLAAEHAAAVEAAKG